MGFLKLFGYLSLMSTVIVFMLGVSQWKVLGNLRLVFWAVVASILADILSLILGNYGIYTWWIANLFVVIHFVFLFVLLSGQIQIALFKILFYGCITFSVINFFLIETPNTFNTYTAYATGILMITAALRFFYQIMNEAPVENLQSTPLFWLALGVLVYYGGTLFIYLFNNYLIARLPNNHQTIWVLHNLLNITKNVFFFATIWVNYKSRTSLL